MTMTLCYHLGDLFHRLPLLDVLHDQLVKHLLLDVLHDHLVKHLLLDEIGGGKCTVFGRGKCPNLGVANVRILGVANVVLANDTQSSGVIKVYSKTFGCLVVHVIHVGLCINSVVGCH